VCVASHVICGWKDVASSCLNFTAVKGFFLLENAASPHAADGRLALARAPASPARSGWLLSVAAAVARFETLSLS